MKRRTLSLLLAGVLSLSLLTACGNNNEPTPSDTLPPTGTVTPTTPVAPTDTPDPLPTESATPEVTPSQMPAATPSPTPEATPSATPAPTPKPTATPAPTVQPTQKPEPTPTPAPTAVSVATIWTAISDGLSDVLPSGMEPGGDILTDLYGISTDDLEEYYFRMPTMSANVTEFFIAKVKSGKIDTVKSACEKRQGDLADGFLYPANVTLVDDYQLVTSGDYILFCITEKADKAVELFNNSLK